MVATLLHPPAFLGRLLRAYALPTILAVLAVALLPATGVRADYTPASAPYIYNVGPNGTYLIASSSLPSSFMALSDATGHFAARTGFSRVLIPNGSVDCGLTVGCTLFDIHLTSLDWAPSCTVRDVGSANWAATFISAGTYNNSGCMLGSTSAVVFLVGMNTVNIQNDWYGYQHVVRHEVSHALGLGDTAFACYTQSGITGYLPLMNNGPCPGPYRNFYLTDNETNAIVSRNGWF